jgi:outer membrane receptor protein involved in Fe transport
MLGGASVLAVVAMAASSAIAADAAPAARSPETPATVQEVVVTAQKRQQSLQKVPLSVTALTAATLNQAGVVDIQGVSKMVPSLTTTETNGPQAQSYRIRGIGSDANIPTFEPDVALFIDGVYLPRSGLSVDDLVDLARVEVLEGPQSTLYGKNATAGVINVVTKGPSHSFEGSLEGSYSELDSSLKAPVYRIAGTISGPITDRIRARLSVVDYSQADSYRNLEPGAPNANNMRRVSVRGEVEADLWAGATLRIDASRAEVDAARTGDPDLLYYALPGQPGGPNAPAMLDFGPLGSAFHITPCPDNNPTDRVICTSSPTQVSTYSNILSMTLNSKVGRNALTSITAVTDYQSHTVNGDAAQTILPIATVNDFMKGGTFSQELRLQSPNGDKLEWLVGGYFQKTDFGRGDDGKEPTFILGPAAAFIPLPHTPALPPAFVLGKPGDEGFLNSGARSDYYALFAQSTYHFNDLVALTLGMRGQSEKKSASVDNSYSVSPATPVVPLGPCGFFPLNLITANLTPTALPGCPLAPINASFSHSTSSLTWNATAEYHPSADTMLYATVSRGGKSFGYNIGFGNTLPGQREFKDEYVTSYEVGAKTSMFEGRARLSVSAFHSDYYNFQNAGFIGLQFLVDNAERVSVNGVEANGTFALGHGFSANGAATWLDAKYDKYTGGSCYWYPTTAPFPAYAPPTLNAAHTGCDLSGRDLPMTPHWRTSAGLQYSHPLRLGSLYSRVDWTWQSSELMDTNLDPRSLQASYSLVNARLGVKTDNGFDISVWGNNIFNRTYILQDGVSNLFGASDPEFQRYLGRPREVGLTVRKSF